MSISDDGKRVAFLGNEGGKEVVGFDRRRLNPSSSQGASWPLTLSGDGSVIAWRSRDPKSERQRVVVAGTEGPEFGLVGRPVLSRDGRVVAYGATQDQTSWFIRIGDREEPPFDYVTDPAVSADGSTVAYGACRENQWFLRVGTAERKIPSKPVHVFLAADGRNVGWVEALPLPAGGSSMRVIVGERAGETFSLVGIPTFSPMSDRVAYGAEQGDRKYVVVGTRKVDSPDRIGEPSFSPDGRRVGYGAKVGRELWWKVIEVEGND